MRGLFFFLTKKKKSQLPKAQRDNREMGQRKRGRGRDSLGKRSFVLLPIKHFTVCASKVLWPIALRISDIFLCVTRSCIYILIYNEQGCVVSLLGPFGWLKAHCVHWMSICSQFGFLPTTPSITRLFGLLKVWVDRGMFSYFSWIGLFQISREKWSILGRAMCRPPSVWLKKIRPCHCIPPLHRPDHIKYSWATADS